MKPLVIAAMSPAVLQARAEESGAASTPAHLQNASAGPFATQPWGEHSRIDAGSYAVERVRYPSQGVELVGNAFVPPIAGRKPAVVVIGPVAYVKEQAPLQYAARLARERYVALVFDPRFRGESGGAPRNFESRRAKVEDLRASIDYLAARPMSTRNASTCWAFAKAPTGPSKRPHWTRVCGRSALWRAITSCPKRRRCTWGLKRKLPIA
ncbi:alpha/beta hydrolase [Variovorax sp. PAMC 28711]|uniref:alpha/beta hydrolase n=1 Tax=Variovorax sp. PAMC 28711 TaxID=1795631 RepID=UPI000B04ACD4|nr:hypothetical protein [Variovorax sp. PAMC 28711]